jgi:WD40 repeat protein
VTANTEGEVQHFHLTSGKCLGTIKDPAFDPQLYCIDYNQDATKLAVSGSDSIIKIYDEEKRTLDL